MVTLEVIADGGIGKQILVVNPFSGVRFMQPELLAGESLEINLDSGTHPVKIPKDANALLPLKNQLAVEFYRVDGYMKPPFVEIPKGATEVFFPKFYYELNGGEQRLVYGEPAYIPFSELSVDQYLCR